MRLWLYGNDDNDQLLEHFPFEVLENIEEVAPDDIVFTMDTIGFLDVQELLNHLHEHTRLFIITQTNDRQKAKRWSEMGVSHVVLLSILAECLEELTGNPVSVSLPTEQMKITTKQTAVTVPTIQKHSNPSIRSSRQLPRLPERQVEEPKRFLGFGKQDIRKNQRPQTKRENGRSSFVREEISESRGYGGKILAITSARGRAGKTTFAANAANTAAANGKRVLLIEADTTGILSSLILHQPHTILSDLFHTDENFTSLTEFIEKDVKYGFDVVFAGEDGAVCNDLHTMKWIKEEVENLRKKYDLILIDTSPEHNTINMEMIQCADRVLFFAQPDVELYGRNSERYRLLTTPYPEGYGVEPECVYLVLSRINKKIHKYQDKIEFARFFHHDPLAEIPEYPDMHKFVRLGHLISESKPNHGYSKKIHQILENFLYLSTNKRKWGFGR